MTTTSTVAPTPEAIQRVLQLATGHLLAAAVHSAAYLDIAGRLADGPRTTADLARDAHVQEDALYRVLRALASVGVFEETAPRTFGLTPAAAALQTGVLRNFALWVSSPFNMRVQANQLHSVRTGEPAAAQTVGAPVFEYLATDPQMSKIFNDAMSDLSASIVPAVLEAYDFGGIGTLVDIAGGHGVVLTAILQKYPAMNGILFDLGHVVEGAKPRIASLGLADRVTTASGDFFTAVPPGGDAYLMKHIIHDWDDARAAAILKNICRALPKGGRVILLEGVIPPGNEPGFGKILDLEMLTMPGGRERTEAEFRALLAAAGFALTRIVPTHSPVSVIEAVPGT